MSDTHVASTKVRMYQKHLLRIRVVMVLLTLSLSCMLFVLWDLLRSRFTINLSVILVTVCTLLFVTNFIIHWIDYIHYRKKLHNELKSPEDV